MEYILTPKSEIDDRIKALQSQMGDIDGALLFQSVDVCYFSGTAQDGFRIETCGDESRIMVQRSTRSRISLPTLKKGSLLPSTLMRSPVLGFRPL